MSEDKIFKITKGDDKNAPTAYSQKIHVPLNDSAHAPTPSVKHVENKALKNQVVLKSSHNKCYNDNDKLAHDTPTPP